MVRGHVSVSCEGGGAWAVWSMVIFFFSRSQTPHFDNGDQQQQQLFPFLVMV